MNRSGFADSPRFLVLMLVDFHGKLAALTVGARKMPEAADATESRGGVKRRVRFHASW